MPGSRRKVGKTIWRTGMIIPDTNLLIYAYNSDSPFHTKSISWLENLLSGGKTVGLVYRVIFSFIKRTDPHPPA